MKNVTFITVEHEIVIVAGCAAENQTKGGMPMNNMLPKLSSLSILSVGAIVYTDLPVPDAILMGLVVSFVLMSSMIAVLYLFPDLRGPGDQAGEAETIGTDEKDVLLNVEVPQWN